MSQSFTTSFGKLEDLRVEKTKKHRLLDIIAIAILGPAGNPSRYPALTQFIKAQLSSQSSTTNTQHIDRPNLMIICILHHCL
jgi:hypothetical protein